MKKTTKTKKQTVKKEKAAKVAEPAQPVSPEKPRTTKAVSKYNRISPQRVRPVINTVRFKPVFKALDILQTINQKAARLTTKVLNSAIANAKDRGLEQDRLYISDIRADGGPTLKRFQPRSMGRADRILKRTSHISIELTEGKTQWKVPATNLEPQLEEDAATGKKKKATKSKTKSAGTKKKKAAKASA